MVTPENKNVVAPLVKPTRKKVKKTPQFRCQRATNAIIRSAGVLMRRGAPLSTAQREAIVKALESTIADVRKTFSAPAGEKAPKFSLPE